MKVDRAVAKDKVAITDALFFQHIGQDGIPALNSEAAKRAELEFRAREAHNGGKELVQVVGHLSLRCRERGKLVKGSQRNGFNIWTMTGREFLAQLMSYSSYSGPVPARDDRTRYIGFGTGSQPEVSSVIKLTQPIAFDIGGNFLAQVALPTYPLTPARTTVRYTRSFSELELSVTGTVVLTEAGLFTDGSPTAIPAFDPGTRDITLAAATQQAPNAYKTFEPLKKTQNFILEASWEIRF